MAESFVVAAPPVASVPVAATKDRFPVRRIYCVGRNYAEHVREMGGDEREPPFFFQKPSDCVRGPDAVLPYPTRTADFQHEVELVLAIGRGGRAIAAADAARHVWGIAVGIDMTRRDLQLAAKKAGRPWEAGKSFDASAPCSAIVPLEGRPLPERGRIELFVNGALRQSGDIAQMIWRSDEVVSQLSLDYALEPGDLVMTGTPAGVGTVRPGDELLARIEGVGELRVRIGPVESGVAIGRD